MPTATGASTDAEISVDGNLRERLKRLGNLSSAPCRLQPSYFIFPDIWFTKVAKVMDLNLSGE
jgi:hypothetical protein